MAPARVELHAGHANDDGADKIHHQADQAIGAALLDQQLAGFVSKLGAYAPMWAVAFTLLARSGEGDPDDRPLRWVDVERELERADRRALQVIEEPRA